MAIKIFNGKKIKISKLSKKDLGRVKEFQDFINSLVAEDAQIRVNKKKSLPEEKDWLKKKLAEIKKREAVVLKAEHNNLIVGSTGVDLGRGRKSHVGKFWIAIRKGYRAMGLGTFLSKEIIELAKKDLKPKPKILSLSVYPTNKGALKLYKKFGFKKAASIPKQIQFKGNLISEIIMLLELRKR